MAAWYAGAFAVAMTVVILFLSVGVDDQSEPFRSCTAKTLECWQTSRTDVFIFAVIVGVLLLLVSLPGSLVALAIMTVSRVRSAMVTGTVAAFAGWFSCTLGVLWIGGVGVPWL
ncbi:hypothetical protein GCM10023194_45080 [Planotetraspora phitsanulokensis]|uniref:Uncharacterized protein n=1 Tax=Planotetraspora phitsanulokensis TaxID=575192 RepID=A0A8J3U466_9ACTN|nr:hypothetical protein [Planotetraspora phitsanulokensis]GII38109.1 hypothetical protein Pph01_31120 [Planotetraspora phitsanulokensis]